MNYYIRLNWPEIEYSSKKISYEFTRTGLDFVDQDYWSGISFN
jgi:hypothetical protein